MTADNAADRPNDRNAMLKVEVRCRATGLSNADGSRLAKHAHWDGYVRVPRGDAHGISGSNQFFFDSPTEIGSAIEKALADVNVRLHVPQTMRNKLCEL